MRSSPPPPPDLAGAAAAQGAANREAAITSSRLNNPNVNNPYGSQTWQEGANPDDRPTLTQILSPEQQALYEQSVKTKGLLGGLGEQGATALQGIVGKQLDFSGAPQVGGYDQTRQKVIDAMMGRTNEDYSKQTDQANSDLIAAGIRPGTKAYADRMQMIERSRNDARQQAEIAGGNAASQAFNTDSQRRKDAIAEILSQRGVPLNEITALMSGSQVSNPFAVPGASQGVNIAPAPTYGAARDMGGYQSDIYNADVGAQNARLQGLFGLGSSAAVPLMFAASDRRLKSNIVRIGTHPLGIGIYEYDIFGYRDVGVMADELAAVMPEAVVVLPNGYLMVNYASF